MLAKEDKQFFGDLLDSKLKPLETRVSKFEKRFDLLDGRMSKLEKKFDVVINFLDKGLMSLKTKVDKIENHLGV